MNSQLALKTLRPNALEIENERLRAELAGLLEVRFSQGYLEALAHDRCHDQVTNERVFTGRSVKASRIQVQNTGEVQAAAAPVRRTHEETLRRTVHSIDNHNVYPLDYINRLQYKADILSLYSFDVKNDENQNIILYCKCLIGKSVKQSPVAQLVTYKFDSLLFAQSLLVQFREGVKFYLVCK